MKNLTLCLVIVMLNVSSLKADSPLWHSSVSLDNLPICYNYHCGTIDTISLDDSQWSEVEFYFKSKVISNSYEEREQIAKSIGLLERIAGRVTPISNDLPKNSFDPDGDNTGKNDCIDETTNTTSFLRLMEQNDLLVFHKVGRPLQRATWWMAGADNHYSASIIEIEKRRVYAVDSWFKANGRPPYIQKKSNWLKKRRFKRQVE